MVERVLARGLVAPEHLALTVEHHELARLGIVGGDVAPRVDLVTVGGVAHPRDPEAPDHRACLEVELAVPRALDFSDEVVPVAHRESAIGAAEDARRVVLATARRPALRT